MESFTPSTGGAWLVFGLSGQLGQAFAHSLHASDPSVIGVSRQQRPACAGVTWREGELAQFADPHTPVAAIGSLGPLDAFARWFEQSSLVPQRIVAIGSTSVHGKQSSPDPGERALAATLRNAERALAATAAQRGCCLTVLRPTLVYGSGRDHSLSRVVRMARRWNVLPLPIKAGGLRQPVHVDDVATAALHALRSRIACPGFFDLPGGEILAFDEMLRRSLAVAAPKARVVRLPGPIFRSGVGLMRAFAGLAAAGDGVMARMAQDLVYDPLPAQKSLSHYPRGFQPSADMFPG